MSEAVEEERRRSEAAIERAVERTQEQVQQKMEVQAKVEMVSDMHGAWLTATCAA